MVANIFKQIAVVLALTVIFIPAVWAADVECPVPEKAPEIHVFPRMADVVYDFSQSSDDLAEKSGGLLDAGDGERRVVGGLHEDHPTYETQAAISYAEFPSLGVGCLWFEGVSVKVTLAPRIYVASEFNRKGCREAVLTHEKRHGRVNREVMNKYMRKIALAMEDIVNEAGVVGPFGSEDYEWIKNDLEEDIREAVEYQVELMADELDSLQAEVDSPEEYERVGKICHKSGVDMMYRH